MARPSERDVRYKRLAQSLGWGDLRSLWAEIKSGSTPDWHNGKALEHLVARGFELSGLEVEYPYYVPPGGRVIEEIDGIVYLGQMPFLIECKDRDGVDIETFAKLRNQLMRRPPATMGCIFSTGAFSSTALILADFAIPHQITLWSSEDIETALGEEDFKKPLLKKYHNLCKYGMTELSPIYKSLEDTYE